MEYNTGLLGALIHRRVNQRGPPPLPPQKAQVDLFSEALSNYLGRHFSKSYYLFNKYLDKYNSSVCYLVVASFLPKTHLALPSIESVVLIGCCIYPTHWAGA